MFITQLIKSPQLLSYSILLGTANHQKFSTYNMLFSVANLLLSILLIQKFGLIGVAAATAFTQILFYSVVTPVLTSKVVNFSLIAYFKETYLRSVPASLLLFGVLSYFAKFHPPTGYVSLIGEAILAAIIYIAVIYWTLLNPSDRKFANDAVQKLVARIA